MGGFGLGTLGLGRTDTISSQKWDLGTVPASSAMERCSRLQNRMVMTLCSTQKSTRSKEEECPCSLTQPVGKYTCGNSQTPWRAGWGAQNNCDCDQSKWCQNCDGYSCNSCAEALVVS